MDQWLVLWTAFTLSKILSSGVSLGFPLFSWHYSTPIHLPWGVSAFLLNYWRAFPPGVRQLSLADGLGIPAISLRIAHRLFLLWVWHPPLYTEICIFSWPMKSGQEGVIWAFLWYKIASSSAEAINPCFLWNVTFCHPAHQTVSSPVSFGTNGKLRTIILYRVDKNFTSLAKGNPTVHLMFADCPLGTVLGTHQWQPMEALGPVAPGRLDS